MPLPVHEHVTLRARQQKISLVDMYEDLVKKALQPPPESVDVVLRRLDRLEKAMKDLGDGLTKTVQALAASLTALDQRQKTRMETTQQELGQVGLAVQTTTQAQRTLAQTVQAALVDQGERQERLVEALRELAEEGRPSFRAKVFGLVTRDRTAPPNGRQG
jgi:hypothetical protein